MPSLSLISPHKTILVQLNNNKQIWQTHTKAHCPNFFIFVLLTRQKTNTFLRAWIFHPTPNMGRSILSVPISSKLSQVFFLFLKNPKNDPFFSHS
jgi:hypothetical protein